MLTGQLGIFITYKVIMHSRQAWLNIGLWVVLYLLWVAIFQNNALTIARTATIQFCYLIFIAGNYYLHVCFSVPRFLYQKKYLQFALVFIGGITAGALLRVPLAMYISSRFFNIGNSMPGFATLFINSFINIAVWVICLLAVKLVADRIQSQQYVDRIEKERLKAELDFLKAQFNPHFLFNSINSIYAHIDKKNSGARNMLLTFSEMLRYQLYECNTDVIAIDKEIAFIKNYILLQQARMEESLIVKLNVDETIKGFCIAPLLFISFIENAFKYVGNTDEQENRIEITMTKQDDIFTCWVFNTKDNAIESLRHKGGIGIANARRRLDLLYAGKHNLAINDTAKTYEVTLNITVA